MLLQQKKKEIDQPVWVREAHATLTSSASLSSGSVLFHIYNLTLDPLSTDVSSKALLQNPRQS